MRNRCVVLMSTLACALFAHAAPRPTDDKIVYYFPTTVGDKLVYECTRDGERVKEWTERVTEVEKKDGMLMVSVVWVDERKKPETQKTLVSEKGIFGGKSQDSDKKGKGAKEVWMLKIPAKAGETWGEKGLFTIKTIGEEEVKVPAGTFKAVKVQFEMEGDFRLHMTDWYAPRVGTVKNVTRISVDGVEIEGITELKSFAPGK